MTVARRLAHAVSNLVLTKAQREHVRRVGIDDAGHGWDAFGASGPGVAVALCVTRHLHDYYFRVSSYGTHNIPGNGPTIVVANHSGMLPLDAMMLWADILLNTDPPRVPRVAADFFVPALPFVSTLFARGGVVAGSRGNARTLLAAGEMLELFPEGVRGIGKPFSERYKLQRWTVGHAELAIANGATVLPVGIVGAEEQWPQLGKIDSLHAFGIPYVPIPATPLPMPVHYHIHYGKPIAIADDYRREQADDPAAVGAAAHRIRDAVAELLEYGLAERKGLFR